MKKIVVIVCFLMLLAMSLQAQALRIAYINSERIMHEAVDTQEAQRLFQIDRMNWDRQIDDITEEILRLERELDTRRLVMPESGRREAEENITRRIRERQQLIERIYGERGLAAIRNEELLAPIMEKLRDVIDRLAEEDGYHIIFDAATSGIVWAQERMDITDRVIIEMNRER